MTNGDVGAKLDKYSKAICSKMALTSSKNFEMSIGKSFKFVFYLLKYAKQKDKSRAIELPVKLCIEKIFFSQK